MSPLLDISFLFELTDMIHTFSSVNTALFKDPVLCDSEIRTMTSHSRTL